MSDLIQALQQMYIIARQSPVNAETHEKVALCYKLLHEKLKGLEDDSSESNDDQGAV